MLAVTAVRELAAMTTPEAAFVAYAYQVAHIE
jgi:hypothetical protein